MVRPAHLTSTDKHIDTDPRQSRTSPTSSSIAARVEMFQKRESKDAFFNMKALAPRERPLSEATEMFDTDFEDDDSEIEEADSPRLSLNSVCRCALHFAPRLY
jgi:hypothetical protein